MNIYDVWIQLKLRVLKPAYTHIRRMSLDLGKATNYDIRVFLFVLVYFMLSVFGAYNLAHLTAFIYMIWLLEKIANGN